MALPRFQTDDQALALLQTSWATELNPLLANVLSNGSLLKRVVLTSGANVVNHKLGRKLQGWFITRKNASADIYDTQDTNATPALTLTLNCSAAVTVDIYVF